MKYIEIKFREQRWLAYINSSGYSILFIARVLKSGNDEIVSIELRGSDLITKEKVLWFKFEDIHSNELIKLNILDSEPEDIRDFDQLILKRKSQLIQGPPLEIANLEVGEQINQLVKRPTSLELDFRNQVFPGLIDSNSYHILLLLSVKVFGEVEQLTVEFSGEDMEKNTTQHWIKEEIGSNKNFNIRFF